MNPTSFLFLTLDSCRYDTFAAAEAPHLRSVGALHRAMAPGNFTYASHLAMFVGFTPGVAEAREPFVNPKYGRIFRLSGTTNPTTREAPFVTLDGRSVVDGFRRRGYRTIGAASMRWFNPAARASQPLIQDFDDFHYAGYNGELTSPLVRQLEFVQRAVTRAGERPVFVFLNVGETHTPYYYTGAPWDPKSNPCRPFAPDNDAAECRRRQTQCLEFVDRTAAALLERFAAANTVVCADHGDAWGEDGLWAHGFSHPAVLEVPLVLRLTAPPPPAPPVRAAAGARRLRAVRRRLRSMVGHDR